MVCGTTQSVSESDEVPFRRVILVRHGHYDRSGDLGDLVWSLSPLGRRQAARTGLRLMRLLDTYEGKFEGIYSSPWPRALQTAEIAAHEIGVDSVKVKPYLHEVAALVGEHDEFLRRAGLPVSSDAERKDAETRVQKISDRFLTSARRSCTCVVVCHGNLIRYLVAKTLGLPFSMWSQMECHHASITEFRIYPGDHPALMTYNDTGHMPPSMVTSASS